MEKLAVAVDLGGTHLRAALVSRRGEIIKHIRQKTQKTNDPDNLADQIVGAINEVIRDHDLDETLGLGLAIPGLLDTVEGFAIKLPNLPDLRDVPIVALIKQRLSAPVHIGNDANLAALGELFFGAGRGYRHLIYMTISTGIGGGIIVDGNLLEGAHGLAAELGHIPLLLDGPLCGCGHHGHFEAFASGTSITRQAVYGARDRKDSLLNNVPHELTTKDVVIAAKEGDDLALKVLRRAGRYIGVGIVTLAHIFDPQRIVIGGGVSNAGDYLLGPAKQTVDEKLMGAYRGKFDIVLTELGDNPGLMGAAALVFRKNESNL